MTQSTNQPGAADLSKRTPEEIFAHHGQALGAEDLDATVMDFADTAVLVTSDGVRRGKDAIRNFFDGLFTAPPKSTMGPQDHLRGQFTLRRVDWRLRAG